METLIIVTLAIIALVFILLASIYRVQRDEAWEEEDATEKSTLSVVRDISYLAEQNTKRHQEQHGLENRLNEFQHQVNHLATVQMLILKEMGKEHQIQPQQDRLVTISDLSDLKKPKERSA